LLADAFDRVAAVSDSEQDALKALAETA